MGVHLIAGIGFQDDKSGLEATLRKSVFACYSIQGSDL